MANEKTNPFPGQSLATSDLTISYGSMPDLVENAEEANLVVSLVKGSHSAGHYASRHKPVIDIDLPVKVLPSSTPGHSHLFIDKELSWSQYCRLLQVMVDVGIVEGGYLGASLARGYSAVRLPWVKK
jgi:hypothetical protein